MSTTNAITSISTRYPMYTNLDAKWSVVDNLYQGTEAMRAAGESMLPRGENEEHTVYTERLAESTLEPLYRQAVDATTSIIISENIEVNTSNLDLQTFFDDVDGSGTDLTQFSETLIGLAVHYGVAYVVIDYPSENQDGRPFIGSINPRNVLGFNTTRVQGQEILTDIRFFETISMEQVDVGDTDTVADMNNITQGMFADRIRQYQLDTETNVVTYTMYGRTKKDLKWVVIETGPMKGLTRIPVVPVYGKKESFMVGSPVYYDAAMMNIKLWRTQSIQDYALKFNRYPAYIVSGIGSNNHNATDNPNDVGTGGETQIPIRIPHGPGTINGIANTEVKIHKFDGQAEPLQLGFEDIDRTRKAIKDNAPVLLLTESPTGDVTATASIIQTAQASKAVTRISRNYTNSLMQISAFVSAYYTISEMPTFNINALVIDPRS